MPDQVPRGIEVHFHAGCAHPLADVAVQPPRGIAQERASDLARLLGERGGPIAASKNFVRQLGGPTRRTIVRRSSRDQCGFLDGWAQFEVIFPG
jgi:hypothetical protein